MKSLNTFLKSCLFADLSMMMGAPDFPNVMVDKVFCQVVFPAQPNEDSIEYPHIALFLLFGRVGKHGFGEGFYEKGEQFPQRDHGLNLLTIK